MKTLLFFILIMGLFGFKQVAAQTKVMTFNIRYGTAKDGKNSWEFRRDMVFGLIDNESCDFVGLQEAMLFQVDEIIASVSDYKFIGKSREVDPGEGEATPILYKHKLWELVDHNTLWLSETPDIPASKSWLSSLPRIFTWAKFKHKETGLNLVVYNTHFDHKSAEARYESAMLLKSHMKANFNDERIIMMGDLNSLEENPPIKCLSNKEIYNLTDSYRAVNKLKTDKDATFYGWKKPEPGKGRRLDYIFHNDNLNTSKSYVNDYNENGRYPSDHLPVIAIIHSNTDKN